MSKTAFFMQDKTPASCGGIDRYYGRPRRPHKYVKGVRTENLTESEKALYYEAFENEMDRKDYGD